MFDPQMKSAITKIPKTTKQVMQPDLALPEDQWHRPHGRMAPTGIARFIFLFIVEIAINLPGLIALRRDRKVWKKSAEKNLSDAENREPIVACVGDNLDEINGIALTSRIMLQKLRERGHNIFLFGIAFHSHRPRKEGEEGRIILAPGRYSMDQAGYPASEVSLIRFSEVIEFFRREKIDLIELQTPGPVSVLCLIAAKFTGIKTLSHYRTDILTYSKLLVGNQLAVWSINTTTTVVTRWAGPVITPSQVYSEKVAEMGIAPERIFKLPRGVDLDRYHPSKAKNGAWQKMNLPEEGLKLFFVGRISREKNLDAIVEIFPALQKAHANLRLNLIIVGDGPYKDILKEKLASVANVYFTGMVQGEDLAGIFANSDLLIFPSLTDTFGNSVVEALASGTPCITSNQGGPQEIIVDGECGFIFDPNIPQDFYNKVNSLIENPALLSKFKSQSRERALLFSYDRAAQAFWDLYCKHFNQSL